MKKVGIFCSSCCSVIAYRSTVRFLAQFIHSATFGHGRWPVGGQYLRPTDVPFCTVCEEWESRVVVCTDL